MVVKATHGVGEIGCGGHLTACWGGGAWCRPRWAGREGLLKEGGSALDVLCPSHSQLQVQALHLRPATHQVGSSPGKQPRPQRSRLQPGAPSTRVVLGVRPLRVVSGRYSRAEDRGRACPPRVSQAPPRPGAGSPTPPPSPPRRPRPHRRRARTAMGRRGEAWTSGESGQRNWRQRASGGGPWGGRRLRRSRGGAVGA